MTISVLHMHIFQIEDKYPCWTELLLFQVEFAVSEMKSIMLRFVSFVRSRPGVMGRLSWNNFKVLDSLFFSSSTCIQLAFDCIRALSLSSFFLFSIPASVAFYPSNRYTVRSVCVISDSTYIDKMAKINRMPHLARYSLRRLRWRVSRGMTQFQDYLSLSLSLCVNQGWERLFTRLIWNFEDHLDRLEFSTSNTFFVCLIRRTRTTPPFSFSSFR